MLKWNKYSIRRQLISVFIIVHVIFLLFLIFYYNYSLRQSYLGQVEDSLYHQALLIRENISADNFQFSNIDQWAREVGGKIEKRITIINRDGQVKILCFQWRKWTIILEGLKYRQFSLGRDLAKTSGRAVP